MALGDPINIDVTVSGETNTIVSFQGQNTNVTRYSGGNSIESTLSENASSVSLESGYNVDVNFTGASTPVQNATYVIGSSATPFSCSDLDSCNLFESGDISGLGTILVSGSGNHLLVSGASSSASIEIKNEGASLTSAVSSINFVGDGIDATNSGPVVTITVNTGSLYPANNPSGFITGVNSGHLLTGASNIGTGSGIYSGTLENDLKFKTLIAGPNIALSGDGQHIMISGTEGGGGGGSTQTASNIGTGSGIYSGTISNDFKLRSISAVSPLSITGSTDDTRIIISGNGIITGAKNIGLPTASGIYKGVSGSPPELLFRKLKGISGVEVAGRPGIDDTIFISGQTGNFYDKSNPSGFITGVDSGHLVGGLSNIGIGSGVFSGTINNDAKLRSISGVGSITITGYEDNTILVSGTGGSVSWTLPPPTCSTGIGTTGQISFDDNYYYICIQENAWRRVAISEWIC